MDSNNLSLSALMALILSLFYADDEIVVLSCPEYQEGFDGSCYEFVRIERSFLSAQGWCERGGGHLVFILNDETQQFLQKHLQPEQDWWLGLTTSSLNLALDFVATKGPLAWLDGSDVSYSNWVNDPGPRSGCAHILRNSGFQWEATTNCSLELHFICQFGLKTIIVHEPIVEFGVLKCYSKNQSTDARNCKALYGSPFQIQVEVQAGTNVTYKIHNGEMLVASSSMVRGIVPHNITVGPEVELQLGSGCYQLTLHASNEVSGLGVSTELQVCLLEPVEGLLASVMAECSKFTLYISVSLERGAPVQLLFQVSGANDSLSETREMQNSSLQIYNISTTIQGDLQVKVRAWNIFSHITVDVGKTTVCHNNSALMQNDHGSTIKKHVRNRRDPSISITAIPETVNQFTQSVNLVVTGLPDQSKSQFQWDCKGNCNAKCSKKKSKNTLVIKQDCLPEIFQFFEYTFSVMKSSKGTSDNLMSVSKCITVIPTKSSKFKISCTSCQTVNMKKDLPLKLQCNSICPDVIWNIENPIPVQSTVLNCYRSTGRKPLIKIQDQNGVKEHTVKMLYLQQAADRFENLNVIVYDKKTLEYAEYTIQIPGAVKPPVVSLGPLACSILPLKGTVIDPFNISCSIPTFCDNGSGCQYCIITDKGGPQNCSYKNNVTSIFLPLGVMSSNYSLSVVVTVTQLKTKTSEKTTIKTQVRPANSFNTIQSIKSAVKDAVANLEQHGKLSGEALGQIFTPVTDMLNKGTSEEKNDRKSLREQMLMTLTKALVTISSSTPQAVQVMASVVVGLTDKGDELSADSQLEAGIIVVNLSSSLLFMNFSADGLNLMVEAATQIVEAVSNILNVSPNKEVSDLTLKALDNVQSALLKGKMVDEDPVIVSGSRITVFVNRVSTENIEMQSIKNPDSPSASFSFPALGADVLSPDKPVDIRMLSLQNNPFSWNEEEDLSGTVGSVSLTRENGSVIPIENLSEEIEIYLPRPEGEQANSTVLDLGNYSTLTINISSPDVTLVLKIKPSTDMSFQMFLGFNYCPDKKQYIAKTQMPLQTNTEEERYTWVLAPSDLAGGVGLYYLVVIPIVAAGVKSVNATVTVTSIAAQCKYWDETKSTWSEDGCRVGPLTTPLVTQCLCNHLTFFGSSFFVKPNTVDVSQTAKLFSTFVNNPVVVCFIGALFVVYLLVIVWARRKDIQDIAKVKVTVLEDNDPLAEYRYMLNVSTGHRRGASTSSQVTVTLLGTEGESEPHHLTDPDKPLFERGAVDTFLLTTPFSLGELQSIRLWHDNSGGHPAWYINKVMVKDVETGQKWYFLCNSWLAVDTNEEWTLDKVFPVATETELKNFSNLFFTRTATDFCDGHIWFSVVSRPPTSTFTRVQRVSCCFSLLLCSMLTNIMFWGIPSDPTEQTMDLGPIKFTWQHVMIGIQSSAIIFPVNFVIVSIFRNTRPREKKPEMSTAKVSKQGKNGNLSSQDPSSLGNREPITNTVTKDIKRISQSLSKAMTSPIPCLELEMKPGQQTDINTLLSQLEEIIRQQNRAEFNLSLGPKKTGDMPRILVHNRQYLCRQLSHVEKKLNLLGSSCFTNPDSYSQAMQQLQAMKGLVEPPSFGGDPLVQGLGETKSIDGDSGSKHCFQGGLPWWFVFIGWILVLVTSVVSGYFTMLYGLTYGKDSSISWLISVLVSFFGSLFITQPLHVIGFAIFFALVLKKVNQDEYMDPIVMQEIRVPDAVPAARRDSKCSLYQPPPHSDIERMRNNMIKEQKMFALIKEILTYMGFMWMLLLVAYGQKDPNVFLLTQYVQQSFSQGISESMSLSDVFNWTNTSLLSNLFGVYPGFITDGNSKLVGNARLRQVRVQKNSCRIANYMRQAISDCSAPYSWEVEDMGSYGPGWNRSVTVNTSEMLRSPWQYQTQARLKAQPIWGSVVLYRGGGFVVELGPNLKNASSTLQYLFDSTWLDTFTRAVFVEFTVYNANVNLFCIVTLMLETTAVGAFQFRSELQSIRLYQSTGGLHSVVMVCGVIYFLFILYYMYVQGKLMKQQKWAYFKDKFNLMELSIILLSWSALSMFINRSRLENLEMGYYQNHKDQFASFHETAAADATFGYLIAFLVLLATVKMWHLLRLSPKLHMITATLQRAWTDISGSLVMMSNMFLAYSLACNLMYGWKLYTYRTLLDAVFAIISLQLHRFNYEEILDYNSVLGAFLIGSCIILLNFVMINLFVAINRVAFRQEQIHHKPSEEEEIVDMMFTKFFSLFGIKIDNEDKEERHSPKEIGNIASGTKK